MMLHTAYYTCAPDGWNHMPCAKEPESSLPAFLCVLLYCIYTYYLESELGDTEWVTDGFCQGGSGSD